MLLELKTKHFKGTEFIDSNGGCAIEKAAKEQIKYRYSPIELVHTILIDDAEYEHFSYKEDTFNKDKEKAKKLRYSNAVVRRIKTKNNDKITSKKEKSCCKES